MKSMLHEFTKYYKRNLNYRILIRELQYSIFLYEIEVWTTQLQAAVQLVVLARVFTESDALKKSLVDFCAAPILNIEHFHEVPSTALSLSRYERIPPLMIVFFTFFNLVQHHQELMRCDIRFEHHQDLLKRRSCACT